MQELLELAKLFGPSVAFMAFTVWRDFNREARMATALEKQSTELMTVTMSSVKAIEQNTSSNNRLTEAIERLPCRTPEDTFNPRRSGPLKTLGVA